jgi:cysteine-rich repeat protein
MSKAQSGVELLILVAVVIAFLSAAYYNISKSREEVELIVEYQMLDSIVESARTAAGLGPGNKVSSALYVPSSLKSVSYDYGEVMLQVYTRASISDLHKQTGTRLVGYNFSANGFMHSGTKEVIFESFRNGICIYTPGNRTHYCLSPDTIGVRLIGFSDDVSDPTEISYRPWSAIPSNMRVDYLDMPWIMDHYIADYRGYCNNSKIDKVEYSACFLGDDPFMVYCTLLLDSSFPMQDLDVVQTFYGCANISGIWYRSPAVYLNISRSFSCGDGLLDDGEECDDGNNMDEDGCSADCIIEILAECGNGILEQGEECDPGGSNHNFNVRNCFPPSNPVFGCMCKMNYIADPANPGQCIQS